jgi:hypothetical protein
VTRSAPCDGNLAPNQAQACALSPPSGRGRLMCCRLYATSSVDFADNPRIDLIRPKWQRRSQKEDPFAVRRLGPAIRPC